MNPLFNRENAHDLDDASSIGSGDSVLIGVEDQAEFENHGGDKDVSSEFIMFYTKTMTKTTNPLQEIDGGDLSSDDGSLEEPAAYRHFASRNPDRVAETAFTYVHGSTSGGGGGGGGNPLYRSDDEDA